MNANEPVAWIAVGDNTSVFFDLDCALSIDDNPTPLYTHPEKELDEQFKKGFEAGKEEGWKAHKFHHPAKTLTISDRDILKIIHDKFTKFGFEADYIVEDTELIDFVRAILRKAQEK